MPFTFDRNNKQINEQANAIGLNQYSYLNRLHVIYIAQVLVIHKCVVIIINVVVVVIITYDRMNCVCGCACMWGKIGWTVDNGTPMTNAKESVRFSNEAYSACFKTNRVGHSDFLCLNRCTIKSVSNCMPMTMVIWKLHLHRNRKNVWRVHCVWMCRNGEYLPPRIHLWMPPHRQYQYIWFIFIQWRTFYFAYWIALLCACVGVFYYRSLVAHSWRRLTSVCIREHFVWLVMFARCVSLSVRHSSASIPFSSAHTYVNCYF